MRRWIDLLHNIRFPSLAFALVEENDVVFLRVCCPAGVNNVTGEAEPWKGRAWRLSPHMTDGEFVQTAFMAVHQAMEHEVREQFTYKGAAVFTPHYDIDQLVRLHQAGSAIKERMPA